MFWDKHKREPEPMLLRFVPAKDITVYELAVIVSKTMLQPVGFKYGKWEEIDPSIQRHFTS